MIFNVRQETDLTETKEDELTGRQRLPLAVLQEWESLQLGAMIGFGMSTFTGAAQEPYRPPAATYAPRQLEINQWLDIVCEFGMRYAVLLAKHNAGFCLWHSAQTEYHCGNGSWDARDAVGLFVDCCRQRGIRPALYYNLGRDYAFCEGHGHGREYIDFLFDNLGGVNCSPPIRAEHITEDYLAYAIRQIEELLAWYGGIYELWLDAPLNVVHLNGVKRVYDEASRISPTTIIHMNVGFTDGTAMAMKNWPTDLINGEMTPPPPGGHDPWMSINGDLCYIPMEVQYRTTKRWFNVFDWGDHRANTPGHVRPVEELVRVYKATVGKGANLVWNLSPDRRARIPQVDINLLREVQKRTSAEPNVPSDA